MFGTNITAAEYQDQGMAAFHAGHEMWACPHVAGGSDINAFVPWMAGWMYAKQIAELQKAQAACAKTIEELKALANG